MECETYTVPIQDNIVKMEDQEINTEENPFLEEVTGEETIVGT